MVETSEEYQDRLEKEKRRRNIKILRHALGLLLSTLLVLWIFFTRPTDINWILIIGLVVIYILYSLYRLLKGMNELYSLEDELHYEDGEIVKYNPRVQKSKKWIPIENVEEVYFNIEEKPDMLYVVHMEEGNKMADSFYKQRIEGKDDLMEDLKERSLLKEKPISYDQLKEIVQA